MSDEVYPTRIQRLLGANEVSGGKITLEAVAGLDGDLDISDGDTDFNAETDGTGVINFNGEAYSDGIKDQSVTVTVVNDNSIVILYQAIAHCGGIMEPIYIWEVFEGATSKGTGNIDNSEQAGPQGGIGQTNLACRSEILVIKNVSAGVHTYDWNWIEDGFNDVGLLKAVVIEVDDTHEAVIQTEAQAGKDLTTPDSHFVKRKEVIP